MKKGLLTIVIALTTIVSVNAQESYPEMYIKPMIGGTLSTLTKLNDAKVKVGLVAGGEFGYRFSNPFAVTAGLLVSMQGAKFKNKEYPNDVFSSLTYINVPILANLYIFHGLAIKAGVQPGYLLTRSKGPDFNTIGEHGLTKTKETRDFDLSFPIGLSYEFSDFVIDARYNFGIADVSNDSKYRDINNRVFMLTIGYKYPF